MTEGKKLTYLSYTAILDKPSRKQLKRIHMRGTPRYENRGINDLSILPTILEESTSGQHLPKFFIKAAKGNYIAQEMSGAEALSYYGVDTFEKKGKFFNHQTMFLKGAMSKAKVIIQRMNMGGKGARSVHYIDIANVNSDVQARIASGSIDGVSPAIAAGVPCIKVRHVVRNEENPVIQDGTMLNEDGTPSKMYPIFAHETLDGEYYNNFGYNFSPKATLDNDDMKDFGQFIYDFELQFKRFGIVKTLKTLSGGKTVSFGLVEGSDPITEKEVSLKEVFGEAYYNETDYTIEWRYTDVEITTFEENVKTITKILATNEAEFLATRTGADVIKDVSGDLVELSDWYENIGSVEDMVANADLMNISNFKSANGVPYFTIFADDTTTVPAGFEDVVVGNENTTFFLSGGLDMSEDLSVDTEEVAEDLANNIAAVEFVSKEDKEDDKYHNEIKSIMAGYLDKNSELQVIALNPESTIWDSGFPVDIKKELCNFIALRGDTSVMLSTYYVNREGTQVISEADEIAIGVLLKNRLLLTPESTFYGTSVGRATICGGSCVATYSDYQGRIPTTYDLLLKICSYMGAGNRVWVKSAEFDAGDSSAALEIKDILPKFTPPSIKGKLWATGINWVEPLYNKKIYHWPAFATVANDNSVRNSIFTMFVSMWICREEVFAWAKFTGESRYTPATFQEKVQSHMSNRLRGKFGGRFSIRPIAYITDLDSKLGYQWHLDTRIGVNNMYTVVRNSITIVRKADF